ncbi:hypothetical protein GGR56DRAFT_629791 [Xylariaceae sp. FL0804]|nr:hypothetical protein GGR56DRAFT_629791 [Xylariaceae sp. FL0804]
MAPIQGVFSIIPLPLQQLNAPSAANSSSSATASTSTSTSTTSRPSRPPMTTKQARKAHAARTAGPKLTKAERRRQELFEQDRIRRELERERAQARGRAAREKKREREEEARREKRRRGKPLVDVRPSQDTIARFVRGGGRTTTRGREEDEDVDVDAAAAAGATTAKKGGCDDSEEGEGEGEVDDNSPFVDEQDGTTSPPPPKKKRRRDDGDDGGNDDNKDDHHSPAVTTRSPSPRPEEADADPETARIEPPCGQSAQSPPSTAPDNEQEVGIAPFGVAVDAAIEEQEVHTARPDIAIDRAFEEQLEDDWLDINDHILGDQPPAQDEKRPSTGQKETLELLPRKPLVQLLPPKPPEPMVLAGSHHNETNLVPRGDMLPPARTSPRGVQRNKYDNDPKSTAFNKPPIQKKQVITAQSAAGSPSLAPLKPAVPIRAPPAFRQPKTPMGPPPIPPRFKSPNTPTPMRSRAPHLLYKPQTPSREASVEPSRYPTMETTAAGVELSWHPTMETTAARPPPSTQFMLSNLEDFLPSPSQEVRELFEEAEAHTARKEIFGQKTAIIPKVHHTALPLVQQCSAAEKPPEKVAGYISNKSSRDPPKAYDSINRVAPVKTAVHGASTEAKASPLAGSCAFDISFFSTQDLFLSSQDVRDIGDPGTYHATGPLPGASNTTDDESPSETSAAHEIAASPEERAAPKEEAAPEVQATPVRSDTMPPPRPSPKSFFTPSGSAMRLGYALERCKTTRWEDAKARQKAQRDLESIQKMEDRRLGELMMTFEARSGPSPRSGSKAGGREAGGRAQRTQTDAGQARDSGASRTPAPQPPRRSSSQKHDAKTRPESRGASRAPIPQPPRMSSSQKHDAKPRPESRGSALAPSRGAENRSRPRRSSGSGGRNHRPLSSFDQMVELLEKEEKEKSSSRRRQQQQRAGEHERDRDRDRDRRPSVASEETDYDYEEGWDDGLFETL